LLDNIFKCVYVLFHISKKNCQHTFLVSFFEHRTNEKSPDDKMQTFQAALFSHLPFHLYFSSSQKNIRQENRKLPCINIFCGGGFFCGGGYI